MMTTKNRQRCLSAELLRQLSHDEISPAELEDIEEHVSGCDRCRNLLEVAQSDPQWRDEIVPILRAPLESPPAAGDRDVGGSEGESLESILQLLGPTDDPHMLGRIGSYEIVGVIGRGGMGVVFKAYERALNRLVAIKMLLPNLAASGAARKRFAREGQAAAAVIDDNVMPIYSVAEWQGVPYLVTQYSRGATLQKRIQDQGPLELKEILRIGMQTARGLAAAHAQGLVHRDVKPSNILLDGTVERALLTDFGLARAVDDASITRTGIIAGTPQYMSPEQARGGSVDARSDLFGLGCVLYAMCTGRPPFRADSSYAILRMITDDEPRSIREVNPDIPEWLCLLISRLMAKSPDVRFGGALEVADLLEKCLAHVQQPTSVPLPASLAPRGTIGRSIFNVPRTGLIAMIAIAGVALLGLVLWQSSHAPDIAGRWTSEEWGTVVLEARQSGQYEGTITRSGKEQSGTVNVKWSRVERRFNGTWGSGDNVMGKLSLRLVGDEIRGAWTARKKAAKDSDLPRLAELVWTRSRESDGEKATSPTTSAASDLKLYNIHDLPIWDKDGRSQQIGLLCHYLGLAMDERKAVNVPLGSYDDARMSLVVRGSAEKHRQIAKLLSALRDSPGQPAPDFSKSESLKAYSIADLPLWSKDGKKQHVDLLMRFLRSTVDPPSWESRATRAAYNAETLQLIVQATPEIHNQIKVALFRQGSGAPIEQEPQAFMVPGPATEPVAADVAPIIACLGPKNPTRLGAVVADADVNKGLDQNIVWLHVWDWSQSDLSRVMLIQKSELGVLASDGNTMLSTEGETLNLATREMRQYSGFQVDGDQLITSVRLSPSGKYAAAMIQSRTQVDTDQKAAPNSGRWMLRLLELDAETNTGTKIGEFPANANAGVAFSPDETSLTYSNDEHRTIRRDAANGNILNEYQPAVGSLNGAVGITTSPDGRWVATADFHGNIYVWETKSNKLVVHYQCLSDSGDRDFSFQAKVMRFSSDGAYLALVAENRLKVLETNTGKLLKTHHDESTPRFAQARWSADAKTITLLAFFQPTNFVEENGVSTRPTANIFPRVYEWNWREGSPVLKQFGDASRKPIDRHNARLVVEAYLAMGLAGDVAQAGSFEKGNPAEPKQIETIARLLNVKRLAMKSVYVNDPTQPTTALATSVAVRLEEKQPDGQRDGFLVLTLTMSDEGWFVTDIDFETDEGADGELKRFLKSNPKAIGLPPFEDSAGPGEASSTEPGAAKASHRAKSASNIKQIMVAMHKYAAEHKHLPPATLYGKDGKGKVPHSWRVALLPYLENGAPLYNAYQFDEPWHSTANHKVLAQMPAVYRHPSEDPKSNSSAYFVVEGAANDASLPTAFSNKDGIRFRDILDGTSYTIAVVEADLIVPWTKPEDILYDAEHNIPAFRGFHREGFHVGACDGSVKFLPGSISEKLLRAYFSPAGREQVPPMMDTAQATGPRSTANVTRYALKNVKAMDAAHLIGKALPTLGLPGSVDMVAHESTNSITVRGDDATQKIILEQLRMLDAETTVVPPADTGKPADEASAPARPLPDKEGIYWSDRNEDHWVTGMKVVQWPTAVNRKLVVEFLLRNDFPEAREIDVSVYCGGKTSLSLSEGNKASVDIKETRREKQTAAPHGVLTFKEGRAEISFEGLESGEYTLRFHPYIFMRRAVGIIGIGVPFDLSLPVKFDASYASLPIHWGKPVAGLRLGAMFQDARQGEVKRFALRDQARIQLFVQNISSKETECGFDRPSPGGDWAMHLADSAGQQMEGAWDLEHSGIGIRIQPLPPWARLAPGEIQPISGELPKFRVGNEDEGRIPNLQHALFTIVQEPEKLRTVSPYDYVLPAGEYSARFSATLRKDASPDVTIAVESARMPFRVGATQGTAVVAPQGELKTPPDDAKKPTATAAPKLLKLPDEAYTKTGIHCQKFREIDAKRPGGELMGNVLEWTRGEDPLVLGMRVASDAKWNIGGQATVELVVRNASGSDVKFTQTPRSDSGLSVVAIDKDGNEHQAEIAQFRGRLTLHHLLLPRAHMMRVKSFTLRFDPKKRDVSKSGVAAFHLPPGDYKLRCKWNDARPEVAHEGEWTGELVSVEHKFTLTAAPAESEK